MKTNFFETLMGLNAQGDWRITIAKDKDGRLTVSLLLFNEQCGDDARLRIAPMLLKGTAEEIDNGFFETIAAPIEKTSGLFANMEQYLKSLEEARKHSKSETDKKSNKKPADEQTKKYDAQMKKVEELAAQGKYGEAITQLPKPELYPDMEEAIEDKKEELWQKRKEKENNLFS